MMKQILTLLALILGLSVSAFAQTQSRLPPCSGSDKTMWNNCSGAYKSTDGFTYSGNFLEGLLNGKGVKQNPILMVVGVFERGILHGKAIELNLINNEESRGEYFNNCKINYWRTSRNGEAEYQWRFYNSSSNKCSYGRQTDENEIRNSNNFPWVESTQKLIAEELTEDFINLQQIVKRTPRPSTNPKNDVAINDERRLLDAEQKALDQDRQRLTEERNLRNQEKQSSKLSLKTTVTNPDTNGVVIITVRTNADTSSLKINDEELGGRPDGNYVIKKVARVGQDTQFTITATDINGNSDTKTITVSRKTVESTAVRASLNPENIKNKSSRDAVAVLIGISNYKSLPRADFAKDDAQVFYDYAIRALGIKPENIKLLLDADAEEVEIFKAFKTWLPARVKPTTDVYVFYSGHGLPTPDGLGLYLLPYRADRDLISKTAVQFQEINMDIQAAKPKSVTIFMDACYSGQARGGETLIASARPLALKAQTSIFPSSFTVFSASQSDQISSSSPDLKHGIFSYYLMKGMEGDADGNKDGKITLGEMQGYLAENVGRQAGMMSRKQEPQLIGDPSRVLVGR